MLVSYRGRRPELVVDLGCGTGSSSRWAAGWADEVIGVEPGADMIAVARRRASDRMSFRSGWSHDTGLPDACADVVLAVQALHWMEPSSTFAEVARLLRAGGIFAAVDCDWPPVVGDHVAERAWDRCRRRNRVLESRLAAGADAEALRRPVTDEELDAAQHTGSDAHLDRQLADGVRSWSKSGHLPHGRVGPVQLVPRAGADGPRRRHRNAVRRAARAARATSRRSSGTGSTTTCSGSTSSPRSPWSASATSRRRGGGFTAPASAWSTDPGGRGRSGSRRTRRSRRRPPR